MFKIILRCSLAIIYLVAFLGNSLFNVSPADAQASDIAEIEPINLSRSGAASNPLVFVDSQVIHVAWQDKFDGWIYSRYEADQWTSPAVVDLPFREFVPRLFPDNLGRIYALWVDEESTLYYSSAQAARFADPIAWDTPQILAGSALDYDFEADSSGNLHLAYVRGINADGFQAGIYYRNTSGQSRLWAQAKMLYEAAYFRSLTGANANVDIATASAAESTNVFIAWDNQSLSRVYLDRSADGGATWADPQEIDQPVPGQGLGDPFRIRVSAQGDDVLLVWQNGEPGRICKQSYQYSNDQGVTWSEREFMLEELSLCADQNLFLEYENDVTILQSIAKNQVYFLAWDGSIWSNPQLLQNLTGFKDPQTLAPVTMGCVQTRLSGGKVFFAGCDTAGGGDIWWIERDLGDLVAWFPNPSSWSLPDTITTVPSEIAGPVLLAGSEERLHAFWIQTQVSEDEPISTPNKSIYYSGWNGSLWSTPFAIFQTGIEKVYQLSAKTDALGRIVVVWSDSLTGVISLSWANEKDVDNPLGWEAPSTIPFSSSPISHHDLAIDQSGVIYVIYSIPLNENRGIYITSTSDAGETWNQSISVFDGVGASWQMVDRPRIFLSSDGTMHATWSRLAIPGSIGAEGLYYSRSVDSGITWSREVEISDASSEWSKVVEVNPGLLLRFFQEKREGITSVHYQTSSDQGANWGVVETLPSFNRDNEKGALSLVQDNFGIPHLFVEITTPAGRHEIWHWRWDGLRWQADEEKIIISAVNTKEVDGLSAAISRTDGEVGLIYTRQILLEEPGAIEEELSFSTRKIDLQEIVLQPTITTGAVVATQASPAEVGSPEAPITQTQPAASGYSSAQGNPPVDATVIGVALGAVSALLIVLLTVISKVIYNRVVKSKNYSNKYS